MKTKKKAGFTLIEMMIVVAIIAILAGVALPQYNKYVKKSETTEAMRFMKQIIDGEVLYNSSHTSYVAFDTSNSSDTGAAKICFEAPSVANFKNYKVTTCGTSGIIVEAWTTAYDADKIVYSFYPSSMTLNATSDKSYYTGSMYLQDYIDEATSVATYIPKCP